jgi:hypothetical protein
MKDLTRFKKALKKDIKPEALAEIAATLKTRVATYEFEDKSDEFAANLTLKSDIVTLAQTKHLISLVEREENGCVAQFKENKETEEKKIEYYS